MKTEKPKKPTRKELERKIYELSAQQAHVYHFAETALDRATMAKQLGGCVIIEITTLGERLKILPFAIRDGLSDETIAALKKDMARSYELAIMYKPKTQAESEPKK